MSHLKPHPTGQKGQTQLIRQYLLSYARLRLIELKKESLQKPKTKKIRRSQKPVAIFHNNLLKTALLQLITKINNQVDRNIIEPFKQFLRDYFFSFFYSFIKYPTQVVSAVLLSAGIIVVTNFAYTQIFLDLPMADQLTLTDPRVTTRILDRNGEVLYRLYENENRTIIPLSQMPLSVIQATIAIEDKDFYNHHGFSLRGIARAIRANLSGSNQYVHGGSTITQQLVKNRLLSPERTLVRKARELILAILVEDTYSKEQILEMYLNQVAYGGTTYGIEEAAQQYFGKSARELNLAEAALLAGLPQAPSTYTPFGPNSELAKKRQDEVLRRMVEDGYISSEQAQIALSTPLNFREAGVDIKAPHFVMYVKQLLAEKYGDSAIHNHGLIIQTTLDLDLQNNVQEIVSNEVKSLANLKVNNGAALVTNPETGEVLAMVGSSNYFDFQNDGQVNVTLRPRQPGSSIKPITYALALENGFATTTKIEDTPITFNIEGSKPYSPQNYDGKFHGPVSLREALASSYNVPAVKVLAELGVNNLIDKAEEMGITTWGDRSRFGLSLTLGGGEVLMTDMATAYGVFANQGYKVPLNPIIKVTNYRGEVLYKNECALEGRNCDSKLALNPGVAYLITNILSDNNARTPAFGPLSTLVIPDQEVAVKTGTTNNLRDNWTIGYTSDRVVAVWVGNNDNTPMSYVASGVTGASPIWNKIMRHQLRADLPHKFSKPESIATVPICTFTNQPACDWCKSTKEEVFLISSAPTPHCYGEKIQQQLTEANGVNTTTPPRQRLR